MSYLKAAKVGDKIICAQNYSRNECDIFTVDRLTATQAVCSCVIEATGRTIKKSFKLDSGLMIGSGDGFRRRYGSIATEADFNAIALANRLKAARAGLERLMVTESNLAAVEALIDAARKAAKA